jgi:hypothetical protein
MFYSVHLHTFHTHTIPGDVKGWTILSGSTPTGATGPSDDFFGGGKYLYSESNYNAIRVGGFRLQLDFGYAFTGVGMSFAYHLYGSRIGEFKLITTQDGTNWDTIWSKQGNIATGWLFATVAITDNPISIQFVSQIIKCIYPNAKYYDKLKLILLINSINLVYFHHLVITF